MVEKKIDLVIKQANLRSLNISIEVTKTVLELKKEICDEFKVQESFVKLVYKGKILINNTTLEEAGVQDGSAIYLVILQKPETTTEQQTQNQVPQNLSSGGFGLLNQMGYSDRGVNQSQTNQFQEMLNSPFYQNMMQQMFSNPQMIRQMASTNPLISQLIEQRPEILDQLQSPAFQAMMRDPQMLSQAAGMMGRVNLNAMGTMSGNSGSLPQPGSVNQQQSQPNQQQQPQQQQQQFTAPFAPPNFMQFLNTMRTTQNLMQNQYQQQQQQPSQQTTETSAQSEQQPLSQQTTEQSQQTQQQPQQQQQGFTGPFMPPNFMQMLTQLRSQMPQMQNQQQPNPLFNPLLPFQNMQNQFPQQQQENLEEKFAKQIKSLEDMGFTDKQANINALKAANGNVDIAIERLLK